MQLQRASVSWLTIAVASQYYYYDQGFPKLCISVTNLFNLFAFYVFHFSTFRKI